jgi:hypothetical protein
MKMDRTHDLEDQVRRLTGEVEDMRARMARLEGNGAMQNNATRSNRRGFLKLGAGAAMGALGWAAVKVVPAAAATGGYMILGSTNLANASTRLNAQTNDIYPVLAAQSLNFSATVPPGAFTGTIQALGDPTGVIEGVDGWAGGAQAFGVYGLTDAGVGVTGESSTGVGLYARASGRLLQDANPALYPLVDSGQAPNYVPGLFEQVRDTNGVLWIHNKAGAWRRVNTARVDTAVGDGTPFKPFRIVDTRSGLYNGATSAANKGPFGTNTSKTFTITGTGSGAQSIPADAIAVFGNLTVVSFTGSGWLTIAPAGAGTNPLSDPSSVNFAAGMQPAIANSFLCGLNSSGQLTVYVEVSSGSAINYIIDVTGYVE